MSPAAAFPGPESVVSATEQARAARALDAASGAGTVLVGTADGAMLNMSSVTPESGPRPAFAGAGMPHLGDEDAITSAGKVERRLPSAFTHPIDAVGGGVLQVGSSMVGFISPFGAEVHWINGTFRVLGARLVVSSIYPTLPDLLWEEQVLEPESGVLFAVVDVQFRNTSSSEDRATTDFEVARQVQLQLSNPRWQVMPFDDAGIAGTGAWTAAVRNQIVGADERLTWEKATWAAPVAHLLAVGYKDRKTPSIVRLPFRGFPLTHRDEAPDLMRSLQTREEGLA